MHNKEEILSLYLNSISTLKQFIENIVEDLLQINGLKLEIIDYSKLAYFDYIKGHFTIDFLDIKNKLNAEFYDNEYTDTQFCIKSVVKLNLKTNFTRVSQMLSVITLIINRYNLNFSKEKIIDYQENVINEHNLVSQQQYYQTQANYKFSQIIAMQDTQDTMFTQDVYYNKSEIKEVISQIKSLLYTKREIYYTNVDLFKTMDNIDRAITDICYLFSIPRFNLPILPSSKGLFYTNIIIKSLDDDTVLSLSNKINLINSDFLLNNITFYYENQNNNNIYNSINQEFIYSGISENNQTTFLPEFILIVEKDTVFQFLINNPIFLKSFNNYFIVTAKGYPDYITRMFINKIKTELNLIRENNNLSDIKLLYFGDWDSFGVEIYIQYCFGSKSSCLDNHLLSVSGIKWIGLLSKYIKEQDYVTQSKKHDIKENNLDMLNKNKDIFNNRNKCLSKYSKEAVEVDYQIIDKSYSASTEISLQETKDYCCDEFIFTHEQSDTNLDNFDNTDNLSLSDKKINFLLSQNYFNFEDWDKEITYYYAHLKNTFGYIKEDLANNQIKKFNDFDITMKSLKGLKKELLDMRSSQMKAEAESLIQSNIILFVEIIRSNLDYPS